MEYIEAIATAAVQAGYAIHQELGPGLLESVYEAVLADELASLGLPVQRQLLVPIVYRGRRTDNALRADLLIDGKVLIELKSTEAMHPAHAKQVFTYLRLLQLPLGFLMNFGLPTFKQGVKRLANNYYSGT